MIKGPASSFVLPSYLERKDYSLLESLSGTQDCGRVVRSVRRVREMLTFDGHTVIVTVRASALAFRTACKPVSSIDLDSRLGSGDFKHPPACWGVEFSRSLELSLLRPVDDPAVVIAFPVFQGWKISLDIA